MEELVAELGPAFLCADLELTPEVREDHASYIASLIKALKNDKRAIFSAAPMRSMRRISCTACKEPPPLRRQREGAVSPSPTF